MRKPHVDDRVRLTTDVPELSLHRGDVGVVRSIWFAPDDSYEVEFQTNQSGVPARCLLPPRQIELQDEPS
jgi:hypothetical protein